VQALRAHACVLGRGGISRLFRLSRKPCLTHGGQLWQPRCASSSRVSS
jgi:hypothetical protein